MNASHRPVTWLIAAALMVTGQLVAIDSASANGYAVCATQTYTDASTVCKVLPGYTVNITIKGGNGGNGGTGGNGGNGGSWIAVGGPVGGPLIPAGGVGGAGGIGGAGGAGGAGAKTTATYTNDTDSYVVLVLAVGENGSDGSVGGNGTDGAPGTPGTDGTDGLNGTNGGNGTASSVDFLPVDLMPVGSLVTAAAGGGGTGGGFGSGGKAGQEFSNGDDGAFGTPGGPGSDGAGSTVSTNNTEIPSIALVVALTPPPAPPAPATYTIDFNANGGSCPGVSSVSGGAGTWYQAPSATQCTLAGSTLTGWTAGGVTYSPGQNLAISDSNTLTAVWTKNATPSPTPSPSASPSSTSTATKVERTITIACERTTVSGKPGIMCDGVTTGFATDDTVKPYVRFPGQTEYAEGTARPRIDAQGKFTWSRKTGKKAYVYFTDESGQLKSNKVIIAAN